MLGVVCVMCTGSVRAGVVFSEIMYNPPAGPQYEYVELATTDGAANVSGWSLASGVQFMFPAGTNVPAGGRLVICAEPDTFLAAYPDADPAFVFGPWQGDLDNMGEALLLTNAPGAVVEICRFDDDAPWDFLADGFGPSLERVCLTAGPSLPENWRSGPVPASEEEFGGTPLEPAGFSQCPPEPPQRPSVRISEIMYHPVRENDYEDRHEFVEIANAGADPIDCTNWRLVGGIDYVFPPVTINPGGYLVIAFDRIAFLEDTGYAVDPALVLGDYGAPDATGNVRSLDNGGEKVGLITAAGVGVDSVSYDDDFPWPVGADALGAGELWLPGAWVPLENHEYRGRSLERVNLSWPSNSIANWLASPLDEPTPGGPSSVVRDVPKPVVEDIDTFPAEPHSPDELIRETDQVKITIRFSHLADEVPGTVADVSDVRVEYFIEDVERTNETRQTIAARDDGTDPDEVAGDFVFTGLFPARPDRTIVRYRILADRGEGQEVVSPRPSDPYGWFAYYVSPVINTETRVYEVFISSSNWGRMWTNAEGGRVSGCSVRAAWSAKVPAIFVYEGKVYDVWARYQGSRWNRLNGPRIRSWPYPSPSTGTFRALSWHINFPRYDQMEGLKIVLLNKLEQACPGLTNAAGYRFFEAVGIPACRQRFIRFYVNGGYIRYMQELERIGETMIRRWIEERREANPDLPREEVGHLFKSVGCNCDEGPYGWGDSRRLPSRCGFTPLERYEWTYDPKIYEWAGGQYLMDLIEDLNDARAAGVPAIRAYFEENFDIGMLTDYIAIINWAVPFDDMFQNHFFYRRTSDEKWFVVPWDLDRNFGEYRGQRNLGADSSLYMGQSGDPDNRSGWWNRLKDAFLRTYREEYEGRLVELNQTVLTPENMNLFLDRALAEANETEANQAAAPMSCSFTQRANVMRDFARRRHQVVTDRIQLVLAEAGEDQRVFAGDTVQFDASGSRPDPGPSVTYTWSNGMTGERPTCVFTEPGLFEITLTIAGFGQEDTDSVKITVLAVPDKAFREEGGLLAMETESFHENLTQGATTCSWVTASTRPLFSGSGYMHAAETGLCTYYSDFAGRSPELVYYLLITNPGTYAVWLRGLVENDPQASLAVGLDGADPVGSPFFPPATSQWTWSNFLLQPITILQPGLHSLSLWIREGGPEVDKILLTTDLGMKPNGVGPAASEELVLGEDRRFVRGDVDGDTRITIGDGINILQHLFIEPGIECADHADSNDDGSLNIGDALYILQFLFAKGPPPPPPYPEAGYDETIDKYSCGER